MRSKLPRRPHRQSTESSRQTEPPRHETRISKNGRRTNPKVLRPDVSGQVDPSKSPPNGLFVLRAVKRRAVHALSIQNRTLPTTIPLRKNTYVFDHVFRHPGTPGHARRIRRTDWNRSRAMNDPKRQSGNGVGMEPPRRVHPENRLTGPPSRGCRRTFSAA